MKSRFWIVTILAACGRLVRVFHVLALFVLHDLTCAPTSTGFLDIRSAHRRVAMNALRQKLFASLRVHSCDIKRDVGRGGRGGGKQGENAGVFDRNPSPMVPSAGGLDSQERRKET